MYQTCAALLQYMLPLCRLRGCMTEPHVKSEGMLLFATFPRTAMHLAQAPCEASLLIAVSSPVCCQSVSGMLKGCAGASPQSLPGAGSGQKGAARMLSTEKFA